MVTPVMKKIALADRICSGRFTVREPKLSLSDTGVGSRSTCSLVPQTVKKYRPAPMADRMPMETNSEFCRATGSPALALICGAMTQESTSTIRAAPIMRKLASFARSAGTCVSEGAIEP